MRSLVVSIWLKIYGRKARHRLEWSFASSSLQVVQNHNGWAAKQCFCWVCLWRRCCGDDTIRHEFGRQQVALPLPSLTPAQCLGWSLLRPLRHREENHPGSRRLWEGSHTQLVGSALIGQPTSYH